MKSRYFFSAALTILMLCISLSALAAPPTKPSSLEARVAALENLVVTLQNELAANTAADTAAHHDKYTDDDAVRAVGPHSPDFTDLLRGVSRLTDPNTGKVTLRFERMNVQIVNGSGFTAPIGGVESDGTGNLIIGYNELRSEDNQWGLSNERTGSHMLVIGTMNNYTSFGGMVVGYFNEASSDFASVSGGFLNRASGIASSVSGGYGNEASGITSSVSGGYGNHAGGDYSSVSGGTSNIADNFYSSVSGGFYNIASGQYSSVSGGEMNTAVGDYSSVSGGYDNEAFGPWSSVSGGAGNLAWGDYSSVSGGVGNTADGLASSVSGGLTRVADGDYDWVAGELLQEQ